MNGRKHVYLSYVCSCLCNHGIVDCHDHRRATSEQGERTVALTMLLCLHANRAAVIRVSLLGKSQAESLLFETKVEAWKGTGSSLKETFYAMKGTFTNGEVACVMLCFARPRARCGTGSPRGQKLVSFPRRSDVSSAVRSLKHKEDDFYLRLESWVSCSLVIIMDSRYLFRSDCCSITHI